MMSMLSGGGVEAIVVLWRACYLFCCVAVCAVACVPLVLLCLCCLSVRPSAPVMVRGCRRIVFPSPSLTRMWVCL